MSWKGLVLAAGLWLPPGRCQPERLLQLWRDGCTVWHAHQGLLLLFPTPYELQAETSAALPILPVDQGWASFPKARPEPGQLVLLWQGDVWTEQLQSLPGLDLASLWEGGDLVHSEGQPLIQPKAKPQFTQPEKTSLGDIRQILGDLPAPSTEQRTWATRIRENQPQTQSQQRGWNPLLGFFDLLGSFFHTPENQRYVATMIKHFEKENWDQALRYAIPVDSGTRQQLLRFLGRLKPRRDLSYTSESASSAIGSSDDALEMLRGLYRQAVQKLTNAWRIEEAAFVQAELLGDGFGGVNLLEQHGRYEAAAKLATIKHLSAPLQVRLWFRAGKVQVALSLARRHFAHAEALVQLEQRSQSAAREFRQAWAEDLAGVGRFSEAVQVGWRVREILPDFRSWMEHSLDGSDPEASQVMALALADSSLSQSLGLGQRLDIWFAGDEPSTLGRRRTLLGLLRESKVNTSDPAVRTWAGKAARQLIRQAGGPFEVGDYPVMERLIEISGDGWLKMDKPRSLPRWSAKLPLQRYKVERAGMLPIFDAAPLGDGRILVALGHAGLAVVSRQGAISQRFPVPAFQLVAPMHGNRHLAISDGRISVFQDGQVHHWCSAQMDGFAADHDGYHWIVWQGYDLYQIDLSAAWQGGDLGWRALGRAVLPLPPLKLAVSAQSIGILMEGLQQFHHSPSLAVTSSDRISSEVSRILTSTRVYHLEENHGCLFFHGQAVMVEDDLLWVEGQNESFGVVASTSHGNISLCLFQVERPREQLFIDLPGASQARVRVREQTALICDSRGRLLVVDLPTRQLACQIFL